MGKHDTAKSQLKQNQSYLIKLKIDKVVTNLEIIQPQFLTGQHFLVFDKSKLKNVTSETLSIPLKHENDVLKDKSIFDSYHLVIFKHWFRLFHLYHYLCKSFAAPHYTNPNLSQIWHILIGFL